MKIVDRLKDWVGLNQLEDSILLSRYGAKSIDDLWAMIMADRAAEPTKVTLTKDFRLAVVNKVMHEKANFDKHGLHWRKKTMDEVALVRYQNDLKEMRIARRAQRVWVHPSA